ncbi:VWA domain-containing protein [Vibrio tritonius]|uniref:VWA domain-containing protein n=1 Tax=Vibrio tritonius TaxID=1435069 RepID=UPI0008387449|nr:VWA domain-containing protein [Vibrio tritonius]
MSDFVFLSPYWLLTLLPLGLVLLWLSLSRHQQTLIAPHLAQAMGLGVQRKRSRTLSLLALVWTLAAVALAGPSIQKQARPTYSNGSARVLVMDMSMSQYATDISPNRLTQQRYKALDLLKGWRDGYTGLVAFAGGAYTVSPLTSDSATIANLVPNLAPQIMPTPGANVVAGVKKAIEMMTNARMGKGDIVLLTDDIDENQSAQLVSLLKGTHWKLMVLAMGTPQGAPIQLSDGSLMKDGQGDTIVAKVDFNTMRTLTQDLGGVFVPYRGDEQDVSTLLSATKAVQAIQGKNGTKTVTERINNGYWLLFPILLFALLLFRRGVLFIFIAMALPTLAPNHAYASPWLTPDQEGYQAYQNKDYNGAAQKFKDPKWLGAARYQAGDYQGAIDALSQVENPDEDTHYNLANAYAQAKQLDKAQELYESILKDDPNNADAKHNLQVVKQAKKQQQQQQQQQKNNQSSSKNNSSKPNEQQGDKHSQQNQKQSDKGENNNHGNKQGTQNQSSSAQGNNTSQADKQGGDQTKKNPKSGQVKQKQANKGQKSADKDAKNHGNNKQNSADKQGSNQQAIPSPQTAQDGAKPNGGKQQAQANVAQNSSAKEVDPELRKLDQVESVRDPSQLLRAQLYLQAQDQGETDTQGKKW